MGWGEEYSPPLPGRPARISHSSRLHARSGKTLQVTVMLRSGPEERNMARRRLQKMREGEQSWLPCTWPDTVVGLEVLLASRQTLVV